MWALSNGSLAEHVYGIAVQIGDTNDILNSNISIRREIINYNFFAGVLFCRSDECDDKICEHAETFQENLVMIFSSAWEMISHFLG